MAEVAISIPEVGSKFELFHERSELSRPGVKLQKVKRLIPGIARSTKVLASETMALLGRVPANGHHMSKRRSIKETFTRIRDLMATDVCKRTADNYRVPMVE